ncbi:MAG TPA: peptide ABC transporter substrate-binding protein, partial [Thermomicrobiales bacterium]|nr:peptide ABC transporter substrate-binding protein [Thermomicrobiales bacterium]
VRVKDGVELSLRYATSVNQVRQKTQAVVKSSFEEIGIQTQLEQIDAGIFFGGEAGNEQNINHFYWDLAMWTSGPASPIPTSFLEAWYAGPEDSLENVAQRENQWQGQNFQRYVNEDYDALYEELLTVTDLERANEILIAMNDLLIEDVVIIPEVNRAADNYAIDLRLEDANVAMSSFEYNYWNIANWVYRQG